MSLAIPLPTHIHIAHPWVGRYVGTSFPLHIRKGMSHFHGILYKLKEKMHTKHLPTAVIFMSVTSMVKGTSNRLSAIRISTSFSPSGTE